MQRSLVSALIILLPAIILAGAWRLGGASALEDDLIYYLPVRQYVGERIAAGEWPLWNPLTRMGATIAADPQSGLWYPPTWLFAVVPPLVAYPLTIILHLALAGAGMYRFLRALGRHWHAALLGAIAFEFSGYLVAHRAHLTILEAAAWLPWIFYGWQRFSNSGRYEFWALAVAVLGVQMLVQHIQVTIISVALLTGYVLIVLRPKRPSLIWQYPAGLVLGVLIAAVQLVPTFLHLAATGRSAPSYALFVENSWAPTSALLLLFPMIFGTRTPNVWDQPWWGLSHFCEQSAYGTILILTLAVASLWLLRGFAQPVHRLSSPRASGHELRWKTMRPWNREILFWWVAGFIVLVLALGEYTPLARLLFHIPLYRSLRVPARWILGWSMAMPVLASAVVSAILTNSQAAERAAEGVRFAARRLLPVAIVTCLVLMLLARWQAGHLEAVFAGRWNADVFFEGLREAVHPRNPAIWWPIALAAATGYLLTRWVNRMRAQQFRLLFVLMLIDVASVAAFVDVDFDTYRRDDLLKSPPLAGAIAQARPVDGQRLLVPRCSADYARPLEVLWPQSNIRQGIPTLHGYGPLWPVANRLLLRFMPWGSSEEMPAILRNTRLLQSLGVRFVAARSKQERELIETAFWPSDPSPRLLPVAGTEASAPVRAGEDLLWPISITTPGIYELSFDAQPVAAASARWFVRLETESMQQIENARTLTPEDLILGPRRMRFQFRCDQAAGPVRVRVKAERGWPLSVAHASFGRIASPPTDEAIASSGPAGAAAVDWSLGSRLADGTVLYELQRSNPLLYWASRTTTVGDLNSGVEMLLGREALQGPTHVVVEGSAQPPPAMSPPAGKTLSWERPLGGTVLAKTDGAGAAFLVFNETYDSGWSVAIDGTPAANLRVNAVVQGVVVPPGRHTVTWTYRPPGLVYGIGLTALSVLVLALGFLRPARSKAPAPGRDP